MPALQEHGEDRKKALSRMRRQGVYRRPEGQVPPAHYMRRA
jgi:hypothetical protein